MAVMGGRAVVGQQAGMVLNNRAIFINDGLVASGAVSASTVLAPTGTASTTAVMMGLAGSITPNAGGNVMITITGDVNNSTLADGATIQISYGTGAAPANAAALTGTQAGIKINYVAGTAAAKSPFSLTNYVTGLTVGTAYWIDLAVAAVTGGTATVADINITAVEL